MLFYFPAEITLADLPRAIDHWMQLLNESPINAVSEVQISLLGWNGTDRYELKGKAGFGSFIIFDRCYDLADRPSPDWVPRLSGDLFEKQKGDVPLRAAGWFDRRD